MENDQYFLDIIGQLHIWTHSVYDSMHSICTNSSNTNPSMVREGGHEILPLTKELLTTGICVEQEREFFKEYGPW